MISNAGTNIEANNQYTPVNVKDHQVHSFPGKVKIRNNFKLSAQELKLIDDFCDIMNAVKAVKKEYILKNNLNTSIYLANGLTWGTLDDNWDGSWQAFKEKDHANIRIFRSLGNVFSDRACIVYESDELMPVPNEWDYRYLDMISVMPPKWHVKIPAKFGEIGWFFNGFPVNWTTTTHQERINFLYASGICNLLEKRVEKGSNIRFMEIGGGTGEIGYTMCKALGKVTLYSIDLPESLIHSVVNQAILSPEKRHYIYVGKLPLPSGLNESLIIRDPVTAASLENAVINIPNFLKDDFLNHLQLDLAFNTWSFSEINAGQTEDYGRFLQVALGNNGLLFEQNINLRHMPGANYCKEIFAKIFKHRYTKFSHARHPELLSKLYICGGEVDIWGNVDMHNILNTYQSFINVDQIINSMWRKCGKPWAYNAAEHLRGLFESMYVQARKDAL